MAPPQKVDDDDGWEEWLGTREQALVLRAAATAKLRPDSTPPKVHKAPAPATKSAAAGGGARRGPTRNESMSRNFIFQIAGAGTKISEPTILHQRQSAPCPPTSPS